MPVLDVFDEEGSLRLDAPLIVFSTMLFPGDADRPYREKFIANGRQTLLVRNIQVIKKAGSLTDEQKAELDGALLKAIRSLDPDWSGFQDFGLWLTDSRRPDINRLHQAGVTIGYILRHLTWMPEVGHAPTLDKAFFIEASRQTELTPQKCDALRKPWIKFRPVAHLWVAYLYWLERGALFDGVSRDRREFRRYLSLARNYQQQCASMRFAKSRKTILESGSLWEIQPNEKMPQAKWMLHIPAWFERLINSYSSPRSK